MLWAQYLQKVMEEKLYLQKIREYGRANLSYVDNTSPLMMGVLNNSQVWMSHGDTISDLPEGFNIIASTKDVKESI